MHPTTELVDWMSSTTETFEELQFSEEVLSALPSYRMHAEGSCCGYDDSYSDVHLMLQGMGGGLYWAYIRDYNSGYIKLLGKGIYRYEPADYDPGAEFVVCSVCDIRKMITAGEIDLDREFYNYYHLLPAEASIEWSYSGKTITVSETAEMLGCSASRVKKMAEDRMLEGFKVGNDLRITLESVECRQAYMEIHGTPRRGASFQAMNRCLKMTPEMTDACYDWAIRSHEGAISPDVAATKAAEETGMNRNSAKMYVTAVLAMLEGAFFGKDINMYSVNRYLDRIYDDYGAATIENARKSVALRFANQPNCTYYKRALEHSMKVHR